MLRTLSNTPAVGSSTNDNAAAGYVGEFVTATVAVGAAVALTTATTANVTSISLTAGDWDISGQVDFTPGATTSITVLQGGFSLTTATITGQAGGAGLGTDPTKITTQVASVPAGQIHTGLLPVRLSIAATTTVFLVAQGTFTISTLAAFGTIRARRAR